MRPSQRLPSLDGLRGVAAIAVFFGHAGVLQGGFALSYGLAVDLFFMLSGYVLAGAFETTIVDGNAGAFLRSRVVRLYPAYVIGTLIGVALAAAIYVVSGGFEQLPVKAVLAAVFLPFLGGGTIFPLNPPAWSLFFELAVNVAYAGIAKWLTGTRLTILVAASALALLSYTFLHGAIVNAGFTSVVSQFEISAGRFL